MTAVKALVGNIGGRRPWIWTYQVGEDIPANLSDQETVNAIIKIVEAYNISTDIKIELLLVEKTTTEKIWRKENGN